ncbi:hypothetical protein C1H46_045790 [Malus baccata]|uniref:Uncharacterized protein n=1 Tax=Malus baccata TaxID=106549 RepID=A0A540K325_MALBA|nr:hypothetical protein C1H46_045790 [Malus baccata]
MDEEHACASINTTWAARRKENSKTNTTWAARNQKLKHGRVGSDDDNTNKHTRHRIGVGRFLQLWYHLDSKEMAEIGPL